MVEKGKGKWPVEEHRWISPEPRRRSALDKIRAPERANSRSDLPWGSAFSCLQNDPRKRKEAKEGRIEYLTLLKTSSRNVFLEIQDRRLLPRPPRQKGADQTGCHPASGVHRGCGKPVRSIQPNDDNGDAPAASDDDGGVHHSGYGRRDLQWDNMPHDIVAV
ncbi:hypothetical protein LIER_34908 [Lithospermum erythrorhizon]|uniref:Uncharacterized protein n=1 Tax=Lithospermum erythrorhizon TaxID=34254 RepID=A0AAV3NH66_LITER